MAQESAKNPDFKKVWDSMQALMTKYDMYDSLNSLKLD